MKLARTLVMALLALITVTLQGLEYQARFLNHSTVGYWGWLAIGTGTTAESSAHTALVAECTGTGMARAAATCDYEEDYISTWFYTFTNSTAAAIVVAEAGVFDSITPAGSHMLMRGKLASARSVAVGETVDVSMKLLQAV